MRLGAGFVAVGGVADLPGLEVEEADVAGDRGDRRVFAVRGGRDPWQQCVDLVARVLRVEGVAARGQRVLLAEVEGRQGISQVLDVAPLGTEERTVVTDPSGGEVVGLSVDAKTALLEYLQKFYKLGRAGSVLEKVGAVDFATTIAPGVRDVLLIGRVYEAVGRMTKGAKKRPAYDAVVLDAPPTGRIGRFLNVNSEVSEVAKVGPVRNQADSITRLLQSPLTAVHLVTLLEEMPVQETKDAIDELGGLSLRVGSVVANGVRQPLVADEDAEAVADQDPTVRAALEEVCRFAQDTSALGNRVADLWTEAGFRQPWGALRELPYEFLSHAHKVQVMLVAALAIDHAQSLVTDWMEGPMALMLTPGADLRPAILEHGRDPAGF